MTIRKRYMLLMLPFAIALVFAILAFSPPTALLPSRMVDYYGTVMTDEQLESEIGTVYCAFFPLNSIAYFYHHLARQPVAVCFDTLEEIDEWRGRGKGG